VTAPPAVSSPTVSDLLGLVQRAQIDLRAESSMSRVASPHAHGGARPGNYQHAISNSFGFGGHNVALAFGKY